MFCLLRFRFGPYFVQPVIAGLEPDGRPYICGMDSIGAIETAKDFMVAGTATESLLGICESLWKPNMVSGLRGMGGLRANRAGLTPAAMPLLTPLSHISTQGRP